MVVLVAGMGLVTGGCGSVVPQAVEPEGRRVLRDLPEDSPPTEFAPPPDDPDCGKGRAAAHNLAGQHEDYEGARKRLFDLFYQCRQPADLQNAGHFAFLGGNLEGACQMYELARKNGAPLIDALVEEEDIACSKSEAAFPEWKAKHPDTGIEDDNK